MRVSNGLLPVVEVIGWHGSIRAIHEFDAAHTPVSARGNLPGIYLAGDSDAASEYGHYLHQCRVSFDNPYRGSPVELLRRYLGIEAPSFGATPGQLAQYSARVNASSIMSHLHSLGHDGVILSPGDHYAGIVEFIAFRPDQVEVINIYRFDEEQGQYEHLVGPGDQAVCSENQRERRGSSPRM